MLCMCLQASGGWLAGVVMTKCEFHCLYSFIDAVCCYVCSMLCAFPADARLFIIAPVLESLIACNNMLLCVHKNSHVCSECSLLSCF